MTRYDYRENTWEDLHFTRFERTTRKNTRQPINPTNHQTAFRPKKGDKIQTVRRYLACNDAQRIDGISKEALKACGRVSLDVRSEDDYGMSLLPARMARIIYGQYYHDPQAPRRSLDRFNKRTAEFLATDVDRETSTIAYLGDIIVLQTVTPYVSAMIIEGDPMGDWELKEQCFRLLYHLAGNRGLSRARSHSNPMFPHVSFGRFDTLEAAYDFQAALVRQDTSLFAKPFQLTPPVKEKANIALRADFNPL